MCIRDRWRTGGGSLRCAARSLRAATCRRAAKSRPAAATPRRAAASRQTAEASRRRGRREASPTLGSASRPRPPSPAQCS
eukprot:3555543-Rhodomonas_salina.1